MLSAYLVDVTNPCHVQKSTELILFPQSAVVHPVATLFQCGHHMCMPLFPLSHSSFISTLAGLSRKSKLVTADGIRCLPLPFPPLSLPPDAATTAAEILWRKSGDSNSFEDGSCLGDTKSRNDNS